MNSAKMQELLEHNGYTRLVSCCGDDLIFFHYDRDTTFYLHNDNVRMESVHRRMNVPYSSEIIKFHISRIDPEFILKISIFTKIKNFITNLFKRNK